MSRRPLKAADLFCGGGGFTTGAEQAGVDVCLAVNHWRTAIYTHQTNHPNVKHICARIDDIDPRHDQSIPNFDLLLASPECTHHSIARGGRPIDDQKRATPWHVALWTEVKRPRCVVVENVREFRDWGPLLANGRQDPRQKGKTFRAWLKAMESLGYRVDHQLLNAADYGAATKRVRLFITAVREDVYRRGRREIPWPAVTHSREEWKPAWSIIDWSKPCPSIFGRKRPLAEKTLRRIEIGLRKYVGQAFQLKAMGRCAGLTKPITDPLPTIVAARENHAVVVPYLLNYHGGTDPRRDGTERSCSVSDPVPVIPTENRYGLVTPYLLAINHGGDDDRSHSVAEPMATLTTKTGHSIVLPFLTKYYGTGSVQPITEPIDTITTKDRFGLAMASLLQTMRELQVIDIGFRMLEPDELARAQGFPAGYYLHGSKAEQVRQVGNAVCPPVARAICETLMEAA